MSLYRVAFSFHPRGGVWKVAKCWRVNSWASRAVDIDRRTPERKLLRVLSPWRLEPGQFYDPYRVLDAYLAAR